MQTRRALAVRASVREFSAEAVPRRLLTRFVDAGRRAPSARGVEPWEFVVMTRRGLLLKLAALATNGGFIKQAAATILVFCRDTKYYVEDGCAATENILLAAADAGVGACWIAGDKKPYTGQVGALVQAPSELKLVSIIALGWPAYAVRQKKRRALSEVLHWQMMR